MTDYLTTGDPHGRLPYTQQAALIRDNRATDYLIGDYPMTDYRHGRLLCDRLPSCGRLPYNSLPSWETNPQQATLRGLPCNRLPCDRLPTWETTLWQATLMEGYPHLMEGYPTTDCPCWRLPFDRLPS